MCMGRKRRSRKSTRRNSRKRSAISCTRSSASPIRTALTSTRRWSGASGRSSRGTRSVLQKELTRAPSVFWADAITESILAEPRFKDKRPLLIRDEKTASGRVHIGSMRGVTVHGLIAEALAERKVPHHFIWETNDFDPMDGLPAYLDEQTFRPHMGKPLNTVPSPQPGFENYAEYFGQE